MAATQNSVSYTTTKPYHTLNTLGPNTKNVWVAFHGMGHLGPYFLKPFASLKVNENYIVAPQAPSKYYLDDKFKYVGASWLTRIDRDLELQNVLTYVDAVFEQESIPKDCNLILFGFSQGVSIVTRWMASRKIPCKQLCLYAGGIPTELTPSDFDFLSHHDTSVKIIFGDKDHYLTEKRKSEQIERATALFGNTPTVISFEGGHEIKSEILENLV